MTFIKKYGIFAISLLVAYGLFILGSVSRGIGITGNVVNFFGEYKMLFVYTSAGIGALFLLFGLGWLIGGFVKKIVKKKKNEKELQIKNNKENLYEKKLLGDRAKKVKKESENIKQKEIKNQTVVANKLSISDLLAEGKKHLITKDVVKAEEIYKMIKENYDTKTDVRFYEQILNYYNALLRIKNSKL